MTINMQTENPQNTMEDERKRPPQKKINRKVTKYQY